MTVSNGNLYKFMTFFGLLIFFSCVLLPYLKLDDNEKEINDVRRNLVVLSQEREALVNDIKTMESFQNVDDSTSRADIGFVGMKASEIKKGIDLRTEQISLENEILESEIAKQEKIKLFMVGSLVVSFIIIVIGFILWYVKIQRPMNRTIRLNLVKEVSESED
ncbi:hypothetical protein ACUNWD_11425 [Sunxiuqinia sp. A32]|uniref:hypothetical protein n=1 Tax=Sunxiuqinia sp. A32 TaxID=3461496 RepID=UPI0040460A1A